MISQEKKKKHGWVRYDSRSGNPEDWNTWIPHSWDLMFKAIIKTIVKEDVK